jgi:hypothetical protein
MSEQLSFIWRHLDLFTYAAGFCFGASIGFNLGRTLEARDHRRRELDNFLKSDRNKLDEL